MPSLPLARYTSTPASLANSSLSADWETVSARGRHGCGAKRLAQKVELVLRSCFWHLCISQYFTNFGFVESFFLEQRMSQFIK